MSDGSFVSFSYLQLLKKFNYEYYISHKGSKYKIDKILYNLNEDKKVEININNMYGDLLTGEAKKYINNYGANKNELLQLFSELIKNLKESDIDQKELIISDINKKANNKKELKEYISSLSEITSIPANIISIINKIQNFLS